MYWLLYKWHQSISQQLEILPTWQPLKRLLPLQVGSTSLGYWHRASRGQWWKAYLQQGVKLIILWPPAITLHKAAQPIDNTERTHTLAGFITVWGPVALSMFRSLTAFWNVHQTCRRKKTVDRIQTVEKKTLVRDDLWWLKCGPKNLLSQMSALKYRRSNRGMPTRQN